MYMPHSSAMRTCSMDVPKRCVNGACLTAEERLSQSFITGVDADARRSQSDRRRIDVIGESDGIAPRHHATGIHGISFHCFPSATFHLMMSPTLYQAHL
jgi:hypothetical protein